MSRTFLKYSLIYRYRIAIILFLLIVILFLNLVPRPMFNEPCSTVVESREGRLLGARIAPDGQWRFPPSDSLPEKYRKCLLEFEDRYFYYHPGVNPVSLMKALAGNIRSGRVVRGGSTLTMQVCRLARKRESRSFYNKLVEIIWAFNLEARFSKSEILALYASHAPFGSNVVGLEAASWRYFSRLPADLSWAESAALAVLPNAPALVFPGRSGDKLKEKRDRLLTKLYRKRVIDSLTWKLSLAEPVPGKLQPLPSLASHLVDKAVRERPGLRTRSTVSYYLQEKVNELVYQQYRILEPNQIHNLAAVVTSVTDRSVLAYVGNVAESREENNNQVDCIIAPRSTGSILKPFLYSLALDQGLITKRMLLPDIPGRFGNFSPMNFDQGFDGAVPAEEALARSLNIPAVRLLKDFGYPPFYSFLKKAGMNYLKYQPDHYGLSLILGGCEASLWELSGMYLSCASILNHYLEDDGKGEENPFLPLRWTMEQVRKPDLDYFQPVIRPSSIYLTLTSLLEVKRPESEAGWQEFASTRKIAWKTGTSFGFRDGWAIGVTPGYVVGVWAGNADGEGRKGLTGVTAAAPLLFNIFYLLPVSDWFAKPTDDLDKTEICRQSGYLPGQNCDDKTTTEIPSGVRIPVCPYHRLIHLDSEGKFRVNGNCYPVTSMQHKTWFVLPPVMEYYFRQKNPLYAQLPPLKPGCEEVSVPMEFVYPREWNRLFLPTDIDGTPGKIIFELVHRQKEATVFWHLDNQYLGSTNGFHQFAIDAGEGSHTLSVIDNNGNRLTKIFRIVDKKMTGN